MTIQERIIAAVVAQLVSEMRGAVDTVPTVSRKTVAAVEPVEPVAAGSTVNILDAPKRKRRGTERTAKVILNPITDFSNFTHNDVVCYKALAGKNGRNRTPMTDKEVIAAIGRKDGSAMKAAQSSLSSLRNKDVNGNPLDITNLKDARKAVVITVRKD